MEGSAHTTMKGHTVQIVKIVSLVCLAALVLWLSPHASTHQDQIQNNPAIGYRSAGGNDAVARLRQQIIKGEVKLEFNSRNGYLESLLKELRIPVSSQGLVFSKTSFQLHRISPDNPRAIFFNDDVYVGWVRGGEMLEVAAVDPQLGGVFYMLDQTKPDKPQLTQNDECLQCHVSNATRNVPGFVVRSVYPDERGYPIAPLGPILRITQVPSVSAGAAGMLPEPTVKHGMPEICYLARQASLTCPIS